MSSNNNPAISFTLPITCQVCLAKVKEPVSCDNNHVFCKACIVIWTGKNKHCPTCRTPIDSENPYRQLLGGQDNGSDGVTSFSQPMVRKARVKSLFNSYEEEIQRLNDLIIVLREDNHRLSSLQHNHITEGTPHVPSCEPEGLSSLDKLEEVTHLYDRVSKDLANCQQEKEELENGNIALKRENDRLRYDLSQKTPSKVGRFTVAMFETQIEKQKKEIASLEKALAVSDKHIDTLREQLKASTTKPDISQTNQIIVAKDNSLTSTHQGHAVSKTLYFPELTDSAQSTAASTHNTAASCDKLVSHSFLPQSVTSPSEETSAVAGSRQTCPILWKGSPVSQLLASSISSGSTSYDVTSCSETSGNSYALPSPSKRKRIDHSWHSTSMTISKVPQHNVTTASSSTSTAVYNTSTASANSNTRREQADTESMFDGIEATDISMTTDFTDCLRILHTAEKNLKDKYTHHNGSS